MAKIPSTQDGGWESALTVARRSREFPGQGSGFWFLSPCHFPGTMLGWRSRTTFASRSSQADNIHLVIPEQTALPRPDLLRSLVPHFSVREDLGNPLSPEGLRNLKPWNGTCVTLERRELPELWAPPRNVFSSHALLSADPPPIDLPRKTFNRISRQKKTGPRKHNVDSEVIRDEECCLEKRSRGGIGSGLWCSETGVFSENHGKRKLGCTVPGFEPTSCRTQVVKFTHCCPTSISLETINAEGGVMLHCWVCPTLTSCPEAVGNEDTATAQLVSVVVLRHEQNEPASRAERQWQPLRIARYWRRNSAICPGFWFVIRVPAYSHLAMHAPLVAIAVLDSTECERACSGDDMEWYNIGNGISCCFFEESRFLELSSERPHSQKGKGHVSVEVFDINMKYASRDMPVVTQCPDCSPPTTAKRTGSTLVYVSGKRKLGHLSFILAVLLVGKNLLQLYFHGWISPLRTGHGGSAVSTLASHQGEPGSIPGRVARFSQVGIVPDDAVGRRVFSRISSFPRPFIPVRLHTSITLIGSQDLALKSRPNLFTHSSLQNRLKLYVGGAPIRPGKPSQFVYTHARLHNLDSKLSQRSNLRSTQKTVAPFEFRTGLEIEMKFISNHRLSKWWHNSDSSRYQN
ncbi:hypothetical protein PR048_010239 [Dryococelus australis]|uniref:Uncharacterized protein n=1 Tax=Dryococelus australis TaxID=614101 RepID=A0ABQ9I253_9NEOP|nr:hypothetical protein PR048_010239 [Dryococelus australis]